MTSLRARFGLSLLALCGSLLWHGCDDEGAVCDPPCGPGFECGLNSAGESRCLEVCGNQVCADNQECDTAAAGGPVCRTPVRTCPAGQISVSGNCIPQFTATNVCTPYLHCTQQCAASLACVQECRNAAPAACTSRLDAIVACSTRNNCDASRFNENCCPQEFCAAYPGSPFCASSARCSFCFDSAGLGTGLDSGFFTRFFRCAEGQVPCNQCLAPYNQCRQGGGTAAACVDQLCDCLQPAECSQIR
jgi:hypothetical protein